MTKRFLAMVLILIAALAGCARVQEYTDIAKKKGVSDEYIRDLAAWTRTNTVYSEFETNLKVVCTYKSRQFKDSYVREYSRIYLLPREAEQQKAQLMKEMSAEETEFSFYAYTADFEANDFSRAESSWKIFLLDEKGNQVHPVEIRRINRITPVVEQFYPYINQYHGKFYTLRFPRQPDDVKKKLVFTSVLGTITLEWS
ncbi:MAG: hypothetical protein ABFD62_02955 [Syntrophaceae bacterium]